MSVADLQIVIDDLDNSNTPASGTTSEKGAIMQKAYLEGRLRQVCQHIKNKRSYVDFVSDHAHQRIDEHQHLNKLCKDYQLYSPNLDGLIQEILEKVELMVEIESEFLGLLSDREKAEVKMLVDQAKEIFEQLLPLRRKKSV